MTMDERPPTLRELQRWLAARVLPPEQAAALGTEGAALLGWLRLPEGAAPEERVAVYVNGYPARLHESLAETFPAVAHVLGPRAFDSLVHRYVAAVPLPSYNLNDAGAELARFLRSDEPSAGLPFQPDLAELEWRVAAAFHAREQEPADAASLAHWSLEEWERATLRFQPSVALVRSEWPILDVWNHRETPVEEIDVDLRDRPQHVLVFRSGFSVRCEELTRAEAAILAALLDGRSLAEVGALAAEDGDSADASALFGTWMRNGLVAGIG
jgi:hypothetical protein